MLLDEVAFIRDFRELMDGVLYIINAKPDFHLVMATTDPADDTHYSVELLMEPVGTVFAPCAEGSVYESQGGVPVHRVSIYDSYLAGVPVYDLKTGEPITPEQSRARSPDKDSWYRNEGLRWVMGGTAAVGLLQLDTAQRRGIEEHCAHVYVDDDMDFDRALEVLRRGLGNGRVGIGVDIATTTEGTSNPTSVTVIEQRGVDLVHRLIATWKTAAEDVQQNRIGAIVDVVTERQTGGRARALAVDASNERLFADGLRRLLRGKLPVHLVVANEVVDPRPPGYEENINFKQYLGDGYVSEIDDNHCALPPEKYIKDDYRLVKKEKGAFVCKPAADGRHGDTFDSSKLALHALRAFGGKVEASAVAVGSFRQKPAQPFVSRNPFANRFKQKPSTTMS